MRIPVLIEPVAGNGYSARALGLSAHAATKEEAVKKLTETVQSQGDSEVVWIEMHGPVADYLEMLTRHGASEEWARMIEAMQREFSALEQQMRALTDDIAALRQQVEEPKRAAWRQLKGIYKDDPLFDEWQAAIAAYRRQVDEEDAQEP